jgi:dTMP kinase
VIVVIEGTDAAGKKTQSELLAERLKGTRFAFPNYESETGKAILSNLKKEWSTRAAMYSPVALHEGEPQLNALVFQSLQTVNRIELLPAIYEAEARGPVIFDRYWQSAVVYGTLDGLDLAWLRTVQEAPMPKADINILIDVPIEEGFKRRPERRDRYETNREFLEKVRVGYLQMWEAQLDHLGVGYRPWFVVDGIGTVEEVHKRIAAVVRGHSGRNRIDEQKPWTPVAGWPGAK